MLMLCECVATSYTMTTFYDNINDFFEKDEDVKNNLNEPCITILHSKIIKDYMNKDNDECLDEYFENKVMSRFNECLSDTDTKEATEVFDDLCNRVIFIYYNSEMELDDYYSGIYKKKKLYLDKDD